MTKFVVAEEADYTAPFDREMMTYLREIRQTPAVQAVFKKYGRILKIDGSDAHWGG